MVWWGGAGQGASSMVRCGTAGPCVEKWGGGARRDGDGASPNAGFVEGGSVVGRSRAGPWQADLLTVDL